MTKDIFFIIRDTDEAKRMYGSKAISNYHYIGIKDRGKVDRASLILNSSRFEFVTKYITKLMSIDVLNGIKGEISKVNSGDIIILVAARVYDIYGHDLVKSLRKRFPRAKIMCYFVDLVHTFRHSFEMYKKDFDMIFSYDIKEAEKYGMFFLQEPFDYKKIDEEEKIFDITFVGTAKKRLDDILFIFENCRRRNLRCDFHIYGVDDKRKKYADEISYNEYISFDDIVKHVVQSKCVLELVQDLQFNPTTRHAEAMLYGANLLTNCAAIDGVSYPVEENIQCFKRIEDINYDFITKDVDGEAYREVYKPLFSTERFVKTIFEHDVE